MRALSIRQPFAWLVLHAGKDIENRDWSTKNPARRFRGTCFIHASLTLDPIDDDLRFWVKQTSGVHIPCPADLPRGGIVGQVDIVDFVRQSASPWFSGPCGLVLANATALPFVPCRGALGFFTPALASIRSIASEVAAEHSHSESAEA